MENVSFKKFKELAMKSVPEIIGLYGMIFYGRETSSIGKERLWELKSKLYNICSALDEAKERSVVNDKSVSWERAASELDGVIRKGIAMSELEKSSPAYVHGIMMNAICTEIGNLPEGRLIEKAVEKFLSTKDWFFHHIFYSETEDLYSLIYAGI